jgi:hypothetical protein
MHSFALTYLTVVVNAIFLFTKDIMFVVNKNCCQEEKVLKAISFFNQKNKAVLQ